MDRLIHTALSGMRASMDSQRVIASNMANANTLGFRAEMLDQRAVTIEGQPNEARAMQRASVRGADMAAGETIATGRDLDVAVETDALIAVQAVDGIRDDVGESRSAARLRRGGAPLLRPLVRGSRPDLLNQIAHARSVHAGIDAKGAVGRAADTVNNEKRVAIVRDPMPVLAERRVGVLR